MKVLLNHKDKIVSFGLLPTIITLCGLYFFPTTLMLGIGFSISVAALLYDIFRLRSLNFFLLQGFAAIGICFFLRLFTGYEYLPPKSITPTLEFMLLTGAFVHATSPETYQSFLKRLRLSTCFTYTLEAKIIVILSSLHLLTLLFLKHGPIPVSGQTFFFIAYLPPSAIYILCLAINATGIRMAAKEGYAHCLLRIAPVCRKQIYLTPRNGSKSVWDLPIEVLFDGPMHKAERYATHLARRYFTPKSASPVLPRLLLKYRAMQECACMKNVRLYIFPLHHESEFSASDGRFFSFDEITESPERFGQMLKKELGTLQMAAEVWDEFD